MAVKSNNHSISYIPENSEMLKLSVISYNLHGLNQGIELLNYLCCKNNLDTDIVFIQEHWLTPDRLSRLNNYNEK